MYVPQLLDPFVLGPDIEIVESTLPDVPRPVLPLTWQSLHEAEFHRLYDRRGSGVLRLADQQMVEVFLTTDQHLKHQQNLTEFQIAIVVLPTTSWPVIQKHTAKIAAVLGSIVPGDFIEIDFCRLIPRTKQDPKVTRGPDDSRRSGCQL